MPLLSKETKKFKATTYSNHSFNIALNLMKRDFSADRSDQKCAGGISHVWTQEGWLNDPLLFIDGYETTEVRYHDGDIIECAFGQELAAGTSITLIEGGNGVENDLVNGYVSYGSTDPYWSPMTSGCEQEAWNSIDCSGEPFCAR